MSQQILQPLSKHNWQDIRLIASDMDGTLTQSERFDSVLFKTLNNLADSGIEVLIVTGRSAGWVQAIATYLPVVGAIAENGGLFYGRDNIEPQLMTPLDINLHRQQLSQVFKLLQNKFPQIEESPDNRFRLTDWTFEVEGLSLDDLEEIERICQSEGWGFTYSTIQCHLKLPHQDKAYALNKVIQEYFPQLKPEEIVTIGDSPNDESLFDPQQFPISVGVANVIKYRDRLGYLPTYITNKPEVAGFCELAALITKSEGVMSNK